MAERVEGVMGITARIAVTWMGLWILCMPLWSWAGVDSQTFEIRRFRVEGNSLLTTQQLQQRLEPYVGVGRTIEDINLAADAIRSGYEAAGYPVVRVFPPPQTVDQGEILLQIIEGEIENITIAGNRFYLADNIRRSLPTLLEGVKPNTRQLVADIVAANDNPAKQVAVNFQSGQKVGNIDALIQVTELNPVKWTLSVDNTGNALSGKRRIQLGYQHANLFDRDHVATLQVGTSDQPDRGFQISGGYRIPFYGSGLSLDAIASYSDSTSQFPVGFGTTIFNGQGTLAGLRLNRPLASVQAYRHRVAMGLDYKDFDNTCTGATPGVCGTVSATPVSLTYAGSLEIPRFQFNASMSYSSNLGGGQHGDAVDYATARTGAQRDWALWRAQTQLMWVLPQDRLLKWSGSGQYSGSRLVSSEQQGIGGAFSVRGYSERAATGDRGWISSLEVQGARQSDRWVNGLALRPLVFLDAGQVSQSQPLSVSDVTRDLSSVGMGVRGQIGSAASFRLDVGFALRAFPGTQGLQNERKRGSSFGHFGVSFQF